MEDDYAIPMSTRGPYTAPMSHDTHTDEPVARMAPRIEFEDGHVVGLPELDHAIRAHRHLSLVSDATKGLPANVRSPEGWDHSDRHAAADAFFLADRKLGQAIATLVRTEAKP